jgi:hypothetical protein
MYYVNNPMERLFKGALEENISRRHRRSWHVRAADILMPASRKNLALSESAA